jgi:hypothetical protein
MIAIDPATNRPVLPTAQELYDTLMEAIEPDLCTNNLIDLEEKYIGETPELRDARMARYAEAYKKYDAAYAQWQSELDAAVATYRNAARQSAEQSDQQTEQFELTALESAFS